VGAPILRAFGGGRVGDFARLLRILGPLWARPSGLAEALPASPAPADLDREVSGDERLRQVQSVRTEPRASLVAVHLT
jgi:hypothetical protein